MIITLKPETERLINEELKSGHYKDAEEVIQRALQTFHATHQAAPGKVQEVPGGGYPYPQTASRHDLRRTQHQRSHPLTTQQVGRDMRQLAQTHQLTAY